MSKVETEERIGSIEAELLGAYIDRELDEQGYRAVEKNLQQDAEAQHYVIQIEKLNALTRMALDVDLNHPSARAEQRILDGKIENYREKRIDGKRKELFGNLTNTFLAVAASFLLLFIGYQVRSTSLDAEIQKHLMALETEAKISLAEVDKERNRVLEYLPSGKTQTWKSEKGYLYAEVTPIRTLRTKENQYCREYKEVVKQNQKVESKHAISCRVGKEMWKTKLILLNGESKKI